MNKLFYGSEEFLKYPNLATSQQYLDQITYNVDLSKLYKIEDTCLNHQKMPYCPILVQDMYEGCPEGKKFILQVWNKDGAITYQKNLSQKPIAWFITFDTFIFKPHRDDQEMGKDFYYIVFLNKGNSMMKVDVKGQDFGKIRNPVIGYCNKCLFISSEKTIYIINTIKSKELLPGEQEIIDDFNQEARQPFIIDLGLVKNHAFLIDSEKEADSYLIICCETSDNQIDFSVLTYKFKEKKYEIKQASEIVQREQNELDSIIEFKAIFTDMWPFAISRRSSGKVDFYWNYYRVGQTSQSDKETIFNNKFQQVQVNFEGFYLQQLLQKNQVIKVDLKWEGRIGLDVAEVFEENNLQNIHTLFQQKITDKVNFFQTFCLINTSFLVAHDSQIFIYDIIKEEWIKKKIECGKKILKVFRNEKAEGIYNLGILFDDRTFAVLQNEDTEAFRPDKWALKPLTDQRVEGQPKFIASDTEHFRMLYILSQQNNQQFHLQAFTRNKVHEFEKQNQANLGKDSIIMPLFSPGKDTMFIIYNQDKTLKEGTIQLMRTQYQNQHTELNQEEIVTTLVQTVTFNDEEMYELDQPYVALTKDFKDTILMISKKNIYRISVKAKGLTLIKDANISGIQMIDDNFCYALVYSRRCTDLHNTGLKYFTLDMLLETNEKNFLDLDLTVSGPYSIVDFSEENQRISYLKTYEKALIIPALHRSSINFMGILPRNKYLAVKRIQNKFITLDNQNRFTVWNVLTGKLVKQIQNTHGENYQSYEIFGVDQENTTYVREWYQPRTLIVSKAVNHKIHDNPHIQKAIEKAKISSEIRHGQAYIYSESINLFQYKLIEIQDDFTVKEHLSFVHKHLQNSYQRLYIAEDLQFMIEILKNQRVIIYQLKKNEENGLMEWDFFKKFDDFPHDLKHLSECLFMFSPDLKSYLNYDKVKECFSIKNILNDIKIIVPQSIMDPAKENPIDIAKRFKWVSNNQVLICNKWGFEKLFTLQNDGKLEEKTSEQIPAFQSISNLNNIYVESQSLELGDMIPRLLRKYRQLKRKRYIFEKIYDIQIYEELYSIDFNIQNSSFFFVSDLSFSFICWKLVELLADEIIDIKKLDIQTLHQLSLNIFPGCHTILHKLAAKGLLMSYILTNIPIYRLQNEYESEYEMPFIEDLHNKTPLHICYENLDFKTADILLNYLANAPLDHHGKSIVDLLPKLIEKELPSLMLYFDKRMLQTPQIAKINRGCIKRYQGYSDAALTVSSLWVDSKQIKSQIFSQTTDNQKVIEQDVDLRFIDLPDYHFIQTQQSIEFFTALKETEQLEMFEQKSIKVIIDYIWPIAKQYTVQKLLLPFVAYLITYWIYTNIIFDYNDQGGRWGTPVSIFTLLMLVAFSIYFIQIELKQVYFNGFKEYFSSPWNYIDITPPIIIICQAFLSLIPLSTSGKSWVQTIQSIGTLLMWLKLLYFFRINRNTSYLIRMIVKVTVGMRTFLLVLLITVVGFGDAFTSLQNQTNPVLLHDNEDEVSFIEQVIARFVSSIFFTYTMILGNVTIEDFDSDHKIAAAFQVVACTLLVMIVMLNLLISIVSQVYSDVQEKKINEYYQEKATIIAENYYLIPDDVKKSIYKKGQYLLVGKRVYDETFQGQEEDSAQNINERNQQRLEKLVGFWGETLQQSLNEIEQRMESNQASSLIFKRRNRDSSQFSLAQSLNLRR